ncbi:PREDICTED: methyl-CpG-binding domain-containing protein 6 [Tarenaya hassleriana]|uniref:methyl-CpG-binding domain-containing protein 6 n=1 Tax=Tarenaya hassleriana TaxID=28532 RepID=UPI00053C4BD7|nr:PREDICTED: methyl-CpG-binding domain-containing protein 6 [Tarenaya hassleriana]
MSASAPSDHGTGDFPPDPLLSSGSFIASAATTDAGDLDCGAKRRPIPSVGVSGPSESVRSGMWNGRDRAENTAQPAAESKTRKRAAAGDSNWLPPDWRVEDRVRTSGATAGSVDRYYYEPVTGRKFRSKTEVLYYLEHGTLKKSAKKSDNVDGQPDHSEGQGSGKQNRTAKKAKETPFNFDFLIPPEEITWVLTNDPGDEARWTPFMGDGKVPEPLTRDWKTAFSMITTQSGGRMKV